MALTEEGIPSLDRNEVPWRTMYFWRNLVRTLLEIQSALHALKSSEEFLLSLSIQPEQFRIAFENLSQKIAAVHEFLKNVRNEVGGHVKHQSVKLALENMDMDLDRKALISLGLQL
jgi:hypothetical protein